MLLDVIQSEDLSKIRSKDGDMKTSDADKKLNDIFGDK